MFPQLNERVAEFEDLGFVPIPLIPNGKKPLRTGWKELCPAVLWSNVPADANIGLRAGCERQTLFIDADDKNAPNTSETVKQILAGMGLMPDGDYPLVRTVNNGSHFYGRSTVQLAENCRNLWPTLGAGELRYGSSVYVAAPDSTVQDRTYELIAGDLRQLPAFDLQDLRQLADVELATGAAKPELVGALRAETGNLAIPRTAWALLRGKNLDRYRSRSEAEQALLTSLVNVGFDLATIYTLFREYPAAGRFSELRSMSEKEALRWLRLSYSNAERWSKTHDSAGRRRGREAQQWALARPWPGATGNSDMAVYLAHVEIVKQSGALTYAASVRRLAELAGVDKETVCKANDRLLKAGLIVHDRTSVGTFAARYRLGDLSRCVGAMDDLNPSCEEVYGLCANADAFRYLGLGKSAFMVLQHLAERPMTRSELEAATGKGRDTIRRALTKLVQRVDPATGEVLRLVEQDGAVWRIVPGVDLDAAARAVGTAGAGARQHERHEAERRSFKRLLVAASNGATGVARETNLEGV